MIDKEEFENNFVKHYAQKLNDYGLDLVRLYANGDESKYRAVEFLTSPLDEKKVPLGYLRSHEIAVRYGLSISVENFGRGEGETVLQRSFSVRFDTYNRNDDEKIAEALQKLKSAETEFYNP